MIKHRFRGHRLRVCKPIGQTDGAHIVLALLCVYPMFFDSGFIVKHFAPSQMSLAFWSRAATASNLSSENPFKPHPLLHSRISSA